MFNHNYIYVFNYKHVFTFLKSVCKMGGFVYKITCMQNMLLQVLRQSNLQKRVFICARSLCWWCHCQGHWIPVAHDNYRNCGYHLCSPVLFPSKSTCQRGENGKCNLVSFFLLFWFFSVKQMITYICIFSSKFLKTGPAQCISLSSINFGMNSPFLLCPRCIKANPLLIRCYQVTNLIFMKQGPADIPLQQHMLWWGQ